jgi:hypothetical protein
VKSGDKLKAKYDYNNIISEGDIVEILLISVGSHIKFWNITKGLESHWSWGAIERYFDPLNIKNKTPIKNDIEWLDRVQENFKYG